VWQFAVICVAVLLALFLNDKYGLVAVKEKEEAPEQPIRQEELKPFTYPCVPYSPKEKTIFLFHDTEWARERLRSTSNWVKEIHPQVCCLFFLVTLTLTSMSRVGVREGNWCNRLRTAQVIGNRRFVAGALKIVYPRR